MLHLVIVLIVGKKYNGPFDMMPPTVPMTSIPTELHMALIQLLDIMPPILNDWIETTGYGEINRRDKDAEKCIQKCIELHHQWLRDIQIEKYLGYI